MTCPHCQKQIPDDSLVCGYCGKQIEETPVLAPASEVKPNGEPETPAADALPPEPSVSDPSEPVSPSEDSPAKEMQETAEEEMPEKAAVSAQAAVSEQKLENEPSGADKESVQPSEKPPVSQADKTNPPVSESFEKPAKPVSPEKKLEEAYVRRMAKRQRPLKTAGFFWTEFLLLLPVINLVLLFVWAFRKNANANRKAFARSVLIWILLLIIFILIVLLAMIILGVPIDKYVWLQSFQDWAADLTV